MTILMSWATGLMQCRHACNWVLVCPGHAAQVRAVRPSIRMPLHVVRPYLAIVDEYLAAVEICRSIRHSDSAAHNHESCACMYSADK